MNKLTEDKLTIHIVEDEVIIAMDLEDIVTNLGHAVVKVSTSYADALASLDSNKADIFLVDISLKGVDEGLSLAQELDKRDIPHIYISSHKDAGIVQKARATNAYGYVIKPFDVGDIFVALEMAIGRIKGENARRSTIINEGGTKNIVNFADILYAEADGNYTHIYTVERKFTLRSNLKRTHLQVLDHDWFKRVHKSFVVNERHIDKILHTHLILKSGDVIPVSKNY